MIQIEGLNFGYRKGELYKGFDLTLDQPGVYGLFGRNGSGKSTLLKLLAGLLFPRRGQVRVLGHEPRRRHPDLLSQVTLVPEEFHLPDLSPATLQRTHGDFYPAFSAEAFREYLGVFELDADRRFGQMSLGQKKKAVMAFALASFTPVLLLDEPTNGLDIVGRDQFKAIVARPEQAARMVLISTHQAHDLERIMGHILFIDDASLVLSMPMAQIADGLMMGVAEDQAALSGVPALIYYDTLGEQHPYVAANPGPGPGKVHLELLYKALSLQKQAVLAALRDSQGGRHV